MAEADTLRDGTTADLGEVLALNEAALPHVSHLTLSSLRALTGEAAIFRVVERTGRIVAILIGLTPRAAYESENFRWFTVRYEAFVYVDRLVVDVDARRAGLGARLYADVIAFARVHALPRVTCEVNLRPPNEESLRFHERHGFARAGTQETEGGAKEVVLLVKALEP